MSLPHPSADVVKSIEGAIKWFQKSEIKGIQKEYFTNSDGKKDYRMVSCEDCPTLWARFYDLETNRPFFCDRDGIKNMIYRKSDTNAEMVIVGITKMEARC